MGESNQKNVSSHMADSIDFMGQRYVAMIISLTLLVLSIVSLAFNGLHFGLDFTGGLQIEARYSEPVDVQKVRSTLIENGFADAVVVNFGSEFDLKITTQQDRNQLIIDQLAQTISEVESASLSLELIASGGDARLPAGGLIINVQTTDPALRESFDALLLDIGVVDYSLTGINDGRFSVLLKDGVQVLTELLLKFTLEKSTDAEVHIKRTEFVGPQVGAELRDQGGIGLLFALAVVMIYVALRFQFKFSVGAVAALVHDVLIVLGVFSIFKLDFDLTVLAAVLAVIGYSLNDTIVVSDRIRENFRKLRKGSPLDVINQSLTQTLGRTLVTSLTTLLVLLALLLVGGELIRTFSLALIIGIIVGTYSSIYVAANTLLLMNIVKEDLMVPEREGAELDELP